jgi:hypothetical protein
MLPESAESVAVSAVLPETGTVTQLIYTLATERLGPMDDKTEELRDIFMDVSDSETVTESQSEGHGSLTDIDESAAADRLQATVARMRERYDFETDLEDEALVSLIQGFYAGHEDDALAEDLDVTPSAVVTARLDLHLLRDDDLEAAFDAAAFRRQVVGSDGPKSDAELANHFDIAASEAAHYRRVVETQAAARQVSYRFQAEFEDALAEAGLAIQLTSAVRETGLDEATEDIDSLDSDADISM